MQLLYQIGVSACGLSCSVRTDDPLSHAHAPPFEAQAQLLRANPCASERALEGRASEWTVRRNSATPSSSSVVRFSAALPRCSALAVLSCSRARGGLVLRRIGHRGTGRVLEYPYTISA